MTERDPILEVENLRTEFTTERGTVEAVDGVGFEIYPGETFGVVGESGAGKTVTGLSVMDLIEQPGRIVDGEIRFRGEDLRSLSESEMRKKRGSEIAMIFQDPMTALNPAYTVGTQIIDVILEHTQKTQTAARERAETLLDEVGIPDPSQRMDDFPHQFSGGMRQRVLIAMALSCDPDLLIADEPTTALDVTIQAQILDLLRDIQDRYDLSIQLITHDMGIIAEMCDRVGVMYAGKIVEEGPTSDLFRSPTHPYTVGLVRAIPRIGDARSRLETIPGKMPEPIEKPDGCSFKDRCPYAIDECGEAEPPLESVAGTNQESACIRVDEIEYDQPPADLESSDAQTDREIGSTLVDAEAVKKYFTPEAETWMDSLFGQRRYVHAVDGVSLSVREGETLGLVGESGCGKTTLGRTLLHLYEPDEGTVLYAGSDLTAMGKRELREQRSDLQVIFQDPFSSLNPRRTVRQIIGRPLEVHDKVATGQEKTQRVIELLEEVGLDESHLDRYPHEFSGGQKQRIGIARALAVEPDFVVADEPVSALDVSIQAKILNLLMDLQAKHELTYLFIAHDLNVVQHIADRIAVMYLGEIVESGSVGEIFEPPHHPYTEILLSSIPQPDPELDRDRIRPTGEVPSPIDPPSGCRFHTRCPYAMSECESQDPNSIPISDSHQIDCHLFDDEVMAGKETSSEAVIREQFSMADSEVATDD